MDRTVFSVLFYDFVLIRKLDFYFSGLDAQPVPAIIKMLNQRYK